MFCRLLLLISIFCLSCTVWAKASRDDLNQVIIAIDRAYNDYLIQHRKEYLVINSVLGPEDPWQYDVTYSSYVKALTEDCTESELSILPPGDIEVIHMISVFGGLGNLDEMNRDGLALVICHELGHGVGGAPYKKNEVSTEGQADYFATTTCLKKVFKYLQPENPPVEIDKVNGDIYSFCTNIFTATEELKFCSRAMAAIKSGIMSIFKFEESDADISLFTKSNEIAQELNLSSEYYPSYQCRIDTLVNGVIGDSRPSCWFPASPKNL